MDLIERFKERQRRRLKLEGFTEEFINSCRDPFIYALDSLLMDMNPTGLPFKVGVAKVGINGIHEYE